MFRKFRTGLILSAALALLWLWLRRPGQEQGYRPAPMEIEVPPEAPPQPPAPQEEPGVEKQPKMEAPKKARPQAADDLKRIAGIGPKISNVLQDAGIKTYAQLAEMSPEAIMQVLLEGGVRIARTENWPQQAALAANGDWQGLQALQDQFKGGGKA